MVRLIRSKGVGVYFVTQNPLDVPDEVLGQLGNRIQHALRAFTPRDQKAVRAAAETFRQNPDFDCEEAITQLGVGEALVSTLEKKGVPTMVQRTLIRPPSSRMGPVDAKERRRTIQNSPVFGLYDEEIDRESAYEILARRAKARAEAEERARLEEERAREEAAREKERNRSTRSSRGRQTATERFIKNLAGTVGRQVGNALVRGILGSLRR